MKLPIASIVLLAACVADSDEPNPQCTAGKCDGASAPRIITIGADRRPVDGTLIELHVEPTDSSHFTVIREETYFSRREGREVFDREVLVENGDCVLGVHRIMCGDTVDDVVEITRAGDTYDAAFLTPTETRELGTGLGLRRVRWTTVDAAGARFQLVVEGTRNAYAVTLRTTPPPPPPGGPQAEPGYRTLFTRGACTVTGEYGELSCTSDERPVDGSLVELTVAPQPYPRYDYAATIRTAGIRLDGTEYDRTERLDGFELR